MSLSVKGWLPAAGVSNSLISDWKTISPFTLPMKKYWMRVLAGRSSETVNCSSIVSLFKNRARLAAAPIDVIRTASSVLKLPRASPEPTT